jgi:type IV pilus assembly protein PilA
MKSQKGFTLIELMIVVAIIAILAAIAIPAYQDYVIRSQVSEGLSLMDGAKTAVAEFYANTGRFPPSNASAGLASDLSITGNYVTGLATSFYGKGVIVVAYGNKANSAITGQFLSLSAVTNAGSITWVCGSSAHTTTIASKYLPSSCR